MLPDITLAELILGGARHDSGTPVTVMTSGASLNAAALARVAAAVGLAHIFEKPFAPEVFVSEVKGLLKAVKANASPAAADGPRSIEIEQVEQSETELLHRLEKVVVGDGEVC